MSRAGQEVQTVKGEQGRGQGGYIRSYGMTSGGTNGESTYKQERHCRARHEQLLMPG